jgi:hypothetical protein
MHHARRARGRVHEWDCRVETSAIAVLTYLWRRGRSESWAGPQGSATYACSVRQLVIGLAPIMQWTGIPQMDRNPDVGRLLRKARYEAQVYRFVKKHRQNVWEWLHWLQDARLITVTGVRDDQGFWHRTLIELLPTPQLPAQTITAANRRRREWAELERRRVARARRRGHQATRRNLRAILRRAPLTQTERRRRAIDRRRRLAEHAQRVRIRELIARSLHDAAGDHRTHPSGASATRRVKSSDQSSPSSLNRGLTRAHPGIKAAQSHLTIDLQAGSGSVERPRWVRTPRGTRSPAERDMALPPDPSATSISSRHVARGLDSRKIRVFGPGRPVERARTPDDDRDDLRWHVYHDIEATAAAIDPVAVRHLAAAAARRRTTLLTWDSPTPPPRWWLIELWTHTAHGPELAAGGGFRLAFWSETRQHHGPRLDRALRRYQRSERGRPYDWPANPVAAFARFICDHVDRQPRPTQGLAYDIARFNEWTKQQSAYAHYQRPEHLRHSAVRAKRRHRAQLALETVHQQLAGADLSPAADIKSARQLLNSPTQTDQELGRRLYARTQRAADLQQRDELLADGHHPGVLDGRYRAARTHAQRWGLPEPLTNPPGQVRSP